MDKTIWFDNNVYDAEYYEGPVVLPPMEIKRRLDQRNSIIRVLQSEETDEMKLLRIIVIIGADAAIEK